MKRLLLLAVLGFTSASVLAIDFGGMLSSLMGLGMTFNSVNTGAASIAKGDTSYCKQVDADMLQLIYGLGCLMQDAGMKTELALGLCPVGQSSIGREIHAAFDAAVTKQAVIDWMNKKFNPAEPYTGEKINAATFATMASMLSSKLPGVKLSEAQPFNYSGQKFTTLAALYDYYQGLDSKAKGALNTALTTAPAGADTKVKIAAMGRKFAWSFYRFAQVFGKCSPLANLLATEAEADF